MRWRYMTSLQLEVWRWNRDLQAVSFGETVVVDDESEQPKPLQSACRRRNDPSLR